MGFLKEQFLEGIGKEDIEITIQKIKKSEKENKEEENEKTKLTP